MKGSDLVAARALKHEWEQTMQKTGNTACNHMK
jgi:hypothetical protein